MCFTWTGIICSQLQNEKSDWDFRQCIFPKKLLCNCQGVCCDPTVLHLPVLHRCHAADLCLSQAILGHFPLHPVCTHADQRHAADPLLCGALPLYHGSGEVSSSLLCASALRVYRHLSEHHPDPSCHVTGALCCHFLPPAAPSLLAFRPYLDHYSAYMVDQLHIPCHWVFHWETQPCCRCPL